jgi:hypothetical protein
MPPAYQTVFDLTKRPSLIHPLYWFFAIFVFAGIMLSCFAWFACKGKVRGRYGLSCFAAVWVLFCGYIIVVDTRDNAQIRTAVETGNLQTVDGCLQYFRPGLPYGSKGTDGDEDWGVDGVDFSYGAGEVRPAFHAVSTAGGPVHADSRVRVSYTMSPAYHRAEIIKLEVAPHACPVAGHP